VRGVLGALAISAAVAGCGGSHLGGTGAGDASGAGGTGGGVPLEMFASAFQTAFCTPLVACGAFTDLATCAAFEDWAQSAELLSIIASVGRGTVLYDPGAAAACVAAVPQDCSVTLADQWEGLEDGGLWWTFQAISACAEVFTGTLPVGASCHLFDFECVPSAYCNSVVDNCTGTCATIDPPAPLRAVGEDCGVIGTCVLPGICEGTCVVPPDHLAGCDPATQFPCRHHDDYCAVAAGATAPTCLPRLAPGTPCTVDSNHVDPCAHEAYCDGVCVGTPVLGQPCDSRCRGALICTNGICTASPPSNVCQM
jgi:hypothetical protein